MVLARDSSTIDVMTEHPIILGNGCGPTTPQNFFRLKQNGEVAYLSCPDVVKQKWRLASPKQRIDLMCFVIQRGKAEVCEWPRNIPTWSGMVCEAGNQK
jgi:hypothetical protein